MLSLVWPLPICLDSWTYHSRFLCNIALYNMEPWFYHQSHPQLGVVFALAPPLHSFCSYFSTDPPVAYWAPTDLGRSSFSVLSFCFFILVMGFPREEYWSGLPFPSPVDHILSDFSTMTRPSWVAPHIGKRKEILSFATTWMNQMGIMLRETCYTEKDKYCMVSYTHTHTHTYGIWKKKSNSQK